MFSVLRRPFAAPNAVIYSYELSKFFLDKSVTSILEVGCGIGIFAFRYASLRKNAFVLGVDQSEKTLEYLGSNYGKYYKNLQLRSCDFCEEGLNLGSTFDVVYSSDVIEHVTNPHNFVDNIHRHLRVGGKAIVNFPNETNHGINHFNEVDDVRALFAAFSDVRVFIVDIQHPVNKLWLSARAVYESLFSRSTREARKRLYSEREEQGIDCFEESTCYSFINNSGKVRNWMASILAEAFLLIKPTIDIRQVEIGNILNRPRLVAVAIK
ncbi:MAG: class SAM-dependent methyltransferase [Edaphobacter sp.]|nr:class SAM-dependent methyltransferase [Edaphobacter sp.]